ncbi:hypothetical protein RCL1_003978 [Eukaryota sp. TZLM3-RCL]
MSDFDFDDFESLSESEVLEVAEPQLVIVQEKPTQLGEPDVPVPKHTIPNFARPGTTNRILTDYREIMRFKEPLLEVTLSPNNCYIWTALLKGFDVTDKGAPLTVGLSQLNLPGVELEIRFSPDYPMSPPFFRVVKPIFKQQTGHTTFAGAICHEVLSPSGWRPSVSILQILLDLRISFIDGGARIDSQQQLHRYNYQAAIAGYETAIRAHGWK